jgi:NSS family neurotransmitter:Na+ symporter
MTRRNAARSVAFIGLLLGLFHVVFYQKGVLDEWDYWAGTFGLVIFATIEIILFSFVFGIDRGWQELHEGADIKIPGFYKPVMKWVTPLFLVTLLGWWSVTEAFPKVLMRGIDDSGDIPYLWAARFLMLAMFAVGLVLIRRAWSGKTPGSGGPE